jgi:signal peptidase II
MKNTKLYAKDVQILLMKRYNFLFFIFSFVVFIIDQATKIWALNKLIIGNPIKILPFLNFTLVHNEGIAFGIFNDGGPIKDFLLITITILATIFLLIFYFKMLNPNGFKTIIFAFVFGGAIGNIYDRVTRGYVVDFIDVYFKNFHWPVFNIADTFITIGLILIFYLQIFKKEQIL